MLIVAKINAALALHREGILSVLRAVTRGLR